MKKIFVLVAALTVMIGAYALIPKTVQGVPYTPKESSRQMMAASDFPDDPDDLSVPEGEFTFDMIESWSGEGSNRAALVIQWNAPQETNALVFGYRWDGLATGADMVRAVVADHPQLYGLIQYTNVSSPTDPLGGYTINGFGWDCDSDGDIGLKDTKDNKIYYSENGLFIHPRGYDPDKGGSSDYDYDDWKAIDADDFWAAGWYASYWSYWVKGSDDSRFGYSSWGASGRLLEDGDWDGWNFSLNFGSYAWKNFKSAPNPIPAGVATEFKVDGLYYNLTNYGARKVALTAPFEMEEETLSEYAGDINVPAKITVGDETYSVTEIRDNAFENAEIGVVTLPASVAKLGDYAFLNCSLKSLVLPEDSPVPSLGKGVFSGCSSFSQFLLPEGLKAIPAELFKGTSITEIKLPEGIETIGASAFEDCKLLTDLYIPGWIKSIGEKSFSGCTGLNTVKVNSTFPCECSEDAFGLLTAGEAVLEVPMGYTSTYASAAGWNVFAKTSEFALDVKEGDRFAVDGVSYMVTSAEGDELTVMVSYFRTVDNKTDNTSIKTANKEGYVGEVKVPSKVMYQGKTFSVNAVEDKAFYGASELEGIILPEGIEVIPQYAFYDCSSLASVTLPSTVKEIETYAFTYCSALESIVLPEGLVSLGDRCFQSSGLTSVKLPASLTAIPSYCFYSCPLTSIELGDQVTALGNNIFQNCKQLTSVKLPSTIEKLPSSMFSNCSALTSVTIPQSVREMESSVFSGCSSLEQIKLPDSLETIGSGLLQNCSSLTQVKLPEKVTTLQMSLFNGCASLEKVVLSDKITSIPNNAFTKCYKLHTIVWGADTIATEPGIIRLGDNISSIGQYAFQYCEAIKEIILPEGLVTLGGRDIFANTGITQLVIPASVKNMAQNYICENNDSVTFYLCALTPVTVNKWTFQKNYSTNFDIVVPIGCAEAYSQGTGWSTYTLTEPKVSDISLCEMKLIEGILTGSFRINYDMKLPERFAQVNDTIALKGYTTIITLDANGTEPVNVEVTPAADGTFEVEVDGFKAKHDVTATLTASNEENSIVSEAADVEVIAKEFFAFGMSEYNAHFDEKVTPEIIFNDETYSLSDLNFSSSNTEVASVNKRTGDITVKRTEGDAVIRAYLTDDPEVYAEMILHAALAQPVEKFILGDGSENITISYMDIYALCPEVIPSDADIQSYDIEISDPTIATTYSVTAFNPTRKYFELVTHKPGKVDVTFKSQDGSEVSTTYHFTIEDSNREAPKDSWQDGTFWLNEDWFGHTNGSINYIDKDGNVRYRAYESQNAYESFGCTSQYAMIFGGKLYVMSKQATDGGDTRQGGGRLVVADAKTLKKLVGIDNILDDGDGRACVGVNSEKVYIGTTAGIAIFNPETLAITGKVEGIESGSKYANQLGDMVYAGKYVFAIKQAYGTYVIDTATDQVVATLGREEDGTVTAFPQGVTVTADGLVWVAATSSANGKATTLYCYDPADLSLVRSVEMPSHLSIVCGWGSWRPTNFFAERDEVAIWFGSGVESSIVSGNSGYYRWDTKSELSSLQPVYVFPKDMAGKDENTMQAPYASARYDDRSNQLLIAATHGSSSNYRNTWLHFVDCAKGEIVRTIRLKDYYWFPAMAVFPDKYAPEFEEIEALELDMVKDKEGQVVEINVSDRDNRDNEISLSLFELPEVDPLSDLLDDKGSDVEETQEDKSIVEASLEGRKLTIRPLSRGESEIVLRAESNGVSTFLSIPVTVTDLETSITSSEVYGGKMSLAGKRFHAEGFEGHKMRIYSVDGILVAEFEVVTDDFTVTLPIPDGAYIIVDSDSRRTLKCIVK